MEQDQINKYWGGDEDKIRNMSDNQYKNLIKNKVRKWLKTIATKSYKSNGHTV